MSGRKVGTVASRPSVSIPNAREIRGDLVDRQLDAEYLVHPLGSHVDPCGPDRLRIHVDRTGHRLRRRDLGEQFHRPHRAAARTVRVDAALEAGTGLRTQAETLRRPRDTARLEVRRLQQDLGRGVRHLGRGAAHDAGDALRGALAVADEEIGAGQLAFHAVERCHLLAVAREPHHDAATREPAEVVRVQRTAAFEHDVVGDVDDIADRAHPRESQPALHPTGRRSHHDVRGEGDEARTTVGRLDHDVRARDLADDRRGLVLFDVERKAEVGGEVAGDADDAHRVGTVGRDREVEDDVVEPEHLAHVGPERRVRRQLEDAGVIVAESELTRRAQHAFRHDAHDLAPADLEVSRQHRADPGERHHHALFDIRRAANNAQLTVAEVDVGEPDPVGLGVRHDVEDLGGDDTVHVPAGLVDGLDLETELVQRFGDLHSGSGDGRELTNP